MYLYQFSFLISVGFVSFGRLQPGKSVSWTEEPELCAWALETQDAQRQTPDSVLEINPDPGTPSAASSVPLFPILTFFLLSYTKGYFFHIVERRALGVAGNRDYHAKVWRSHKI